MKIVRRLFQWFKCQLGYHEWHKVKGVPFDVCRHCKENDLDSP